MLFVENFEREIEVRVQLIQSYNENHNDHMIGFLNDKNLMMDFLLDEKYHKKFPAPTFISEQKLEQNNAKKFKYNGDDYILVTNVYGTTSLYKVLLPVFDDGMFVWNKNKRYNSMESVVTIGAFEFLCIYHETGYGTVDVRYAKCDNKHRNKVTISTIENIRCANNKMFLEAINQWRETLKNEI